MMQFLFITVPIFGFVGATASVLIILVLIMCFVTAGTNYTVGNEASKQASRMSWNQYS
jgi:hypothetical protein